MQILLSILLIILGLALLSVILLSIAYLLGLLHNLIWPNILLNNKDEKIMIGIMWLLGLCVATLIIIGLYIGGVILSETLFN